MAEACAQKTGGYSKSNRSKRTQYSTRNRRLPKFRSNTIDYSDIFGSSNQPNEEELKFLEASEYGDVPTIRRMVNHTSGSFNVNCVDHMGENALQLSCGNEHLEIVEILVRVDSMKRVGDALLLAISRGYVRIVEEILTHPAFEQRQLLISHPCEQEDKEFYAFDYDGTRFSPDVTPIILAAQCGEFEIVHLLLRRGAVIKRPHHYGCHCEGCREKRNDDSLSFCLCRLNAYKALASPSFMAIAFADPASHALTLSHELTLLASVEKEFKKDYLTLAKQCNGFLETLLDLCRTTEEVQALLDGNPSNQITSRNFRRSKWIHGHIKCTHHRQLKLAIKNKVKKFVAHPNCQQQLKQIWTKNTEWTHKVHKSILATSLFICLPFAALCYLISPNSKFGKTVQSPVVKFAMQGASYLNFVLLLILNVLSRMDGLQFINAQPIQKEPIGRTTSFTWIETAIMVFIVGMFWGELEEVTSEGFRSYFTKLWNLMDILMLFILAFSFSCRFIAYQNASRGQRWWIDTFGENVTRLQYDAETSNIIMDNKTANGQVVVPLWAGYYAFNRTDRKHWKSNDLQLVAEALYSYGIVLSVFRISYILDVSEKFGPLQISLSRTISDIAKWCGIFGIMFGAFIISLYNLYSFYEPYQTSSTTTAFTTLEDTFITLFWSLFGLADYHGVEISNDEQEIDHELTRVVGYQLYGAYNIITVVVMLNMLVAMLNRSYAEVELDSDSEWKFSRAELMLSYFRYRSVLPVPYNLIPSRHFLNKLLRHFRKLKTKLFRTKNLTPNRDTDMKITPQFTSPKMIPGELVITDLLAQSTVTEPNSKQRQYEAILQKIVKRYIIHAQCERDRRSGITDEKEWKYIQQIYKEYEEMCKKKLKLQRKSKSFQLESFPSTSGLASISSGIPRAETRCVELPVRDA